MGWRAASRRGRVAPGARRRSGAGPGRTARVRRPGPVRGTTAPGGGLMPRATRGKLPSSKPREGTAVHAKGTERVASILDAATDTLVEEGHSGLTLRRVAQRA